MTEFTFTAKPDRQGRISIPIAVREALGMKDDDDVVFLEIKVEDRGGHPPRPPEKQKKEVNRDGSHRHL